MALLVALALSGAGRILALVVNQGNVIFNLVGLAISWMGAGLLLWSVMNTF